MRAQALFDHPALQRLGGQRQLAQGALESRRVDRATARAQCSELGARLALLVHHADAEREWAYDRTSPIDMLDKALDEAAARNRTVVDMQSDWARVFPHGASTPRRPRDHASVARIAISEVSVRCTGHLPAVSTNRARRSSPRPTLVSPMGTASIQDSRARGARRGGASGAG